MIRITETWTAIDRGYEAISLMQYRIAKMSRVSGDVSVFNQAMVKSMEIYANIDALECLDIHVTINQDKNIELLFRRIKELTLDIKTWPVRT
jgi:hypothetical protein